MESSHRLDATEIWDIAGGEELPGIVADGGCGVAEAAGTSPGRSGIIPARGKSCPAKGGIFPVVCKTIPAGAGSIPCRAGPFPRGAGMNPRSGGSIPAARKPLVHGHLKTCAIPTRKDRPAAHHSSRGVGTEGEDSKSEQPSPPRHARRSIGVQGRCGNRSGARDQGRADGERSRAGRTP